MMTSSKAPVLSSSQLIGGTVLPKKTTGVMVGGGSGTIGGTVTPTTVTPTTTTLGGSTQTTLTPTSGTGSLSSGASSVGKSISNEGEKDFEYYLRTYWYLPVCFIGGYLLNRKFKFI